MRSQKLSLFVALGLLLAMNANSQAQTPLIKLSAADIHQIQLHLTPIPNPGLTLNSSSLAPPLQFLPGTIPFNPGQNNINGQALLTPLGQATLYGSTYAQAGYGPYGGGLYNPVPIGRTEIETPDKSQNEISRINHYNAEEQLTSRYIMYDDYSTKEQEFRTNGTLANETESRMGGSNGTRISTYLDDGVGLLREMQIKHGENYQYLYHPDGKTIRVKTLDFHTSKRVKQYSENGKIKLQKIERKGKDADGGLEIIVYDNNANELYTQYWMPGTSGYLLMTVEETDNKGQKRRLVLKGTQNVREAIYLKKNGKVDHVEKGSALSEPLLPDRTIMPLFDEDTEEKITREPTVVDPRP